MTANVLYGDHTPRLPVKRRVDSSTHRLLTRHPQASASDSTPEAVGLLLARADRCCCSASKQPKQADPQAMAANCSSSALQSSSASSARSGDWPNDLKQVDTVELVLRNLKRSSMELMAVANRLVSDSNDASGGDGPDKGHQDKTGSQAKKSKALVEAERDLIHWCQQAEDLRVKIVDEAKTITNNEEEEIYYDVEEEATVKDVLPVPREDSDLIEARSPKRQKQEQSQDKETPMMMDEESFANSIGLALVRGLADPKQQPMINGPVTSSPVTSPSNDQPAVVQKLTATPTSGSKVKKQLPTINGQVTSSPVTSPSNDQPVVVQKSTATPTSGSKVKKARRFLACQFAGCGKRFTNVGQFLNHQKSHHSQVFYCRDCHKQFQSRCELDKHLDEHRNALECPFELCERKFVSPRELDKHVKRHSSRPFVCDFAGCAVGYRTKTQLDYHKFVKMH